MKLHLLLAIGLAIGLIVSTFAQQKEPSLSEQDRAQIVAGREGTRKGSSALKPIVQAALQAAVDATAKELLVPGAVVILSTPRASSRSPTAPRRWARRSRHAPTPTSESPRIPRR
jgi:hypothetical protein